MRKVTIANSLGRSLPLTTSVVMAAQAPEMVNIDGEDFPADELVKLVGTRNQRRLQRKALLRGNRHKA